MALTPEQIKAAREKYGITPAPQRNRAAELDAAWGTPREQADDASAEEYGATFPSVAGEGPVKSTLKMVGNVPSSIWNNAKNVFTAGKEVVTNPIKTSKSILDTAKGASENAWRQVLEKTPLKDKVNAAPLSEEEQSFKLVTDHLKSRYGSLDNLQRTITNDPTGFATDLLTLAAPAQGVLKEVGILSKAKVPKGQTIPPTGEQGVSVTRKTQIPGSGTVNKLAVAQMERALQINPSDVNRIKSAGVAGKTPGEWILERGIVGSRDQIETQLGTIARSSKNAVDEGLAGITQKFVYGPANEALDVLDGTFKGTVGNDDIVSRITALKKQENLTLSDMNEIKRMIDRELQIYKATGEVKAGATARGLENIRDNIKTFIEDRAGEHGFTDVKKLNKETQVATEIKDSMQKRDPALNNKRLVSLTDLITGIGGASTIDPTFGIASIAVKRMLESPQVTTRVARALSRLPEKKLKMIEDAYKSRSFSDEVKAFIGGVLEEAAKTVGPLNEAGEIIDEEDD